MSHQKQQGVDLLKRIAQTPEPQLGEWAGTRRLEIDVFANNAGAIRLYEREGFAHEGRRRGAVMVGDEAVDVAEPELQRFDHGGSLPDSSSDWRL